MSGGIGLLLRLTRKADKPLRNRAITFVSWDNLFTRADRNEMKEKDLIFQIGVCKSAQTAPDLHTITIIVRLGSGCAEPDSSLCICFTVCIQLWQPFEEMNHKIRCTVLLIKCIFDLVVIISALICSISTVILQ